MSTTIPVIPALSPGFDRARKLSRVMAGLFTLGFWVTLALLVVVPVMVAVPHTHGSISVGTAAIDFDGLSLAQRLEAAGALAIGALPALFLMHHTRRVFGHFARGEIFALPVIDHIRRSGIWLIVSFFAGIASQILLKVTHLIPPGQERGTVWPLFIGITTVIAAHVMAEAQRIAADHAEIV
jgi:hypothetical protein